MEEPKFCSSFEDLPEKPPHGFWVKVDGTFRAVDWPRQGSHNNHAKVAKKYCEHKKLKVRDPYERVMHVDRWARIVIYDGILHVDTEWKGFKSNEQRRVCQDITKFYKLERMVMDTPSGW